MLSSADVLLDLRNSAYRSVCAGALNQRVRIQPAHRTDGHLECAFAAQTILQGAFISIERGSNTSLYYGLDQASLIASYGFLIHEEIILLHVLTTADMLDKVANRAMSPGWNPEPVIRIHRVKVTQQRMPLCEPVTDVKSTQCWPEVRG